MDPAPTDATSAERAGRSLGVSRRSAAGASVTAGSGHATLAIGAPSGVWAAETPSIEFVGVFAAPSVYLSFDMSPTVELVVNGRYGIGYLRDELDIGYVSLSAGGGALGVRIAGEDRTWAVLPEIGMLRVEDRATFLTLGVTLAVGR